MLYAMITNIVISHAKRCSLLIFFGKPCAWKGRKHGFGEGWVVVKWLFYSLPVMPVYSVIFLILTIANISFPGTSSFVGEFLILLGSFKVNTTITFFSAIGGAS